MRSLQRKHLPSTPRGVLANTMLIPDILRRPRAYCNERLSKETFLSPPKRTE